MNALKNLRAARAARKSSVNHNLVQISPFFEQDFLWVQESAFEVVVFVLGLAFAVVVSYP